MSGKSVSVIIMALGLVSWGQAAELKTDIQKFSYAAGYQIGQSLKRDAGDVDMKALAEAIEDAVKDRPSQMSAQDMQSAFNKRREAQMAKMQKKGEASKKDGEDYLAKNKKKPGVTVTKSGLQYRVIKEGKGAKPSATATVTVHYRGTLVDGSEFDSSIKRGTPATFALNRVVKGWQEALQLMSPGAKYEVVLPASLGYGERGSPPVIPPNSVLIFEIELLDIKG